MGQGAMVRAERTSYTDAETGREVTVWTAPGVGHNVGFYYHQNPFDPSRNLVYFVSNRTGSWQLWRADIGARGVMQVTEFPGFRQLNGGHGINRHGANYWVYISPRSGNACLGGDGRIAVVDPDTLDSRAIWYGKVFDVEMNRLNVAERVNAVCDQYNAGLITADASFREQVRLQAPTIIYHWPEKREEVYATFARTDFTYLGAENTNSGDETAIHADMFARLGEIGCPTLLLPGQHDITSPLEYCGGMARTIPTCEVRVTDLATGVRRDKVDRL